MGGQYSHLQFFRRAPNELLARYFQEKHGVLQDIAFDKLNERNRRINPAAKSERFAAAAQFSM